MAKKSQKDKAGYHLRPIPQGENGELSKIHEELLEAMDAKKQKCELMVLLELSDILGAISLYLKKHHPSLSLSDLITMSEITARAFESGHRPSKKQEKQKSKSPALKGSPYSEKDNEHP